MFTFRGDFADTFIPSDLRTIHSHNDGGVNHAGQLVRSGQGEVPRLRDTSTLSRRSRGSD